MISIPTFFLEENKGHDIKPREVVIENISHKLIHSKQEAHNNIKGEIIL